MTQLDYVRLGMELKAARKRMRPRVSQDDAGQSLGVSRSSVQKIENGQADRVAQPTVLAYVRFVGWTEGSYERVLAGKDPEMASDHEDAPAEQAAGTAVDQRWAELGLPPAVEYELRSGKTLESTVVNLGPDDEDGHIIVVLQGKKDATPEQIARVAARYRRARRHIQSIPTDTDGSVDS